MPLLFTVPLSEWLQCWVHHCL